MRLIEWEVAEDGYEEQIIIPKEQRDLADQEGINTENKQKETVQIMNLRTGESYIGRLAITENKQIYLPTEIQAMLKKSGKVSPSCRLCEPEAESRFWAVDAGSDRT